MYYAFANKCEFELNVLTKSEYHDRINVDHACIQILTFFSMSQLTMSNIIHSVQVLLVIFIIEVLTPASCNLQWEVWVVQFL